MMHAGDIGTVIALDTGVDVTTATPIEIHYKKPNSDTGVWSAVASDTEVRYTTLEGDIDQVGEWEFQAYVGIGSWLGRSSIVCVNVGAKLS